MLVDFWAEWCGPCKMIAPMLDEIAASYQGRLKVAKINIDHNQKTPRNYNVRGIPTLMIFKDGKVAGDADRRRQQDPAGADDRQGDRRRCRQGGRLIRIEH